MDRAGLSRRAGRGPDHAAERHRPAPEAQARAAAIDALAFNPWNTTDDFRPLGNLNRARKAAYDASAAHRGGTRWHTEMPTRNVVAGAAARAAFSVLNRRIPWYRLPVRLAVLNLEAFRHVLRKQNLIDTEPPEAPPTARPVPADPPEEARWARTADGRYNDLSAPEMGAVGATFGRNLKPDYRPDSFDAPEPGHRQRPAADPGTVPARPVAEPACGGLDPVPGPRLGQPRPRTRSAKTTWRCRCPAARTWRNTPDGQPENMMRIAGNKALDDRPGRHPAAVRQRRLALVGRLGGVRLRRGQDHESLREGAKLRLTERRLPA